MRHPGGPSISNLVVRKPPFAFDPKTTPFMWHPQNPEFAVFCNTVTFMAPAFERYIVAVVRKARPLLEGTSFEQEADDFLRQEGQHARAHRLHAQALIAQYPGLLDIMKAADASYDALLAAKPLAFHLAYVANIEATFTPLFKMMLDNEHTLFRGGNGEVASLFLWHFVEEIEHRRSALGIYQTVVPSRWYRLRVVPHVVRHIMEEVNIVNKGINECVPVADRLVDAPVFNSVSAMFTRRQVSAAPGKYPTAFSTVPGKEIAAMLLRILLTQAPFHDPGPQPLPRFADEWLAAEARGEDITHWYTRGTV